ncbi:hypothetical protein DVH24_002297 [Malus domestica]|uniref:Uncharacterized protein n=1 Tax=Malus domestica TaxID=3750 RepID=A0A498I7C0_MALDO|nr:hypothetical protein DVH24_002297 [Malus domestica]
MILSALGPDHVLTNFLVGHPSWDCSRVNSLNFGVPMEPEANELPKGLFNVPQELLVEDKLSKLLESTELYIEITNQGFQIQALNREKSFDDEGEIGEGTERDMLLAYAQRVTWS